MSLLEHESGEVCKKICFYNRFSIGTKMLQKLNPHIHQFKFNL